MPMTSRFVTSAIALALLLGTSGCSGQGNAQDGTASLNDTAVTATQATDDGGIWVMTSVTTSHGTGSPSQTVTFDVDGEGNIVARHETFDATESTVSYAYDDKGYMISSSGSAGSIPTEHDMSFTNELNGNGWLSMSTDQEGRKKTYSYDGDGHLIGVSEEINSKTSIETAFDEDGLVSSVTSRGEEGSLRKSVSYEKNDAGSPSKAEIVETFLGGDIEKKSMTVSYETDENGNISKVTLHHEGDEFAALPDTVMAYEYAYVSHPSAGARVYAQESRRMFVNCSYLPFHV